MADIPVYSRKLKAPMNSLNYLNLLGYIINMVVLSGAGTWFAKQLKSIPEISAEYQVREYEA